MDRILADPTDTFLADMRRFGARRATIRLEHRERLADFARHQRMLALQAVMFLIAFAGAVACDDALGAAVFASLAIVPLEISDLELRRLRATGRTYRTQRGAEIGL